MAIDFPLTDLSCGSLVALLVLLTAAVWARSLWRCRQSRESMEMQCKHTRSPAQPESNDRAGFQCRRFPAERLHLVVNGFML